MPRDEHANKCRCANLVSCAERADARECRFVKPGTVRFEIYRGEHMRPLIVVAVR
jgi:hypothetical protein